MTSEALCQTRRSHRLDAPVRRDLRLIIGDQSISNSRSTWKIPSPQALASSRKQEEAEKPDAALAVELSAALLSLSLGAPFPSCPAGGHHGLNLPAVTQLSMASSLFAHPLPWPAAPHWHNSWGCNRFLGWRTTERCSVTWSLRWMDAACRGCLTSGKPVIPNQIEWITPYPCQSSSLQADGYWKSLFSTLLNDSSARLRS